jgi:hypothetical protein
LERPTSTAPPRATAPVVSSVLPAPTEDGLDALLFDVRVLSALLLEPQRTPRHRAPAA